MIVRVDDLQPAGLRVDLALEFGPLSYEEGLEIEVGGARLTVHVRPSRRGLLCSGRIVAAVSVPCSRCLASYTLPVDKEFELSYLPAPSAGRGGDMELQISREDLDVSYLEAGGTLDMKDLASEQVYLALPMKPLCAPECGGLCAGCGSNLNTETCRCPVTAG